METSPPPPFPQKFIPPKNKKILQKNRQGGIPIKKKK